MYQIERRIKNQMLGVKGFTEDNFFFQFAKLNQVISGWQDCNLA